MPHTEVGFTERCGEPLAEAMLEKALRLLTLTLLFCLAMATLSCGGGNSPAAAASALSGNWEFTLLRHSNTQPFTLAGFLLQSGSTVNGSLTLSSGAIVGCQGVGPATGTFDGQNLQLTVGQFGQDFTLTANLPSGSASNSTIAGQFSTLAGGCIGFASTGTWTAVRIQPLTGPFHGSFVLGTGLSATTIDVTGTLTQGSNVGASNASLSGTVNETNNNLFCSYLSNVTTTGLIGGSTANLLFFNTEGSQIGQITGATVALDGTSLTSDSGLLLNQISPACPAQTGSVMLTFP